MVPNPLFTKRSATRAFSLPELIVTIAIISIVTGIILFKYSSFNNGVLLTSQAYELALDLREAQTYGLSVRSNPVNTVNFDEEYGVYFDIDPAHAGGLQLLNGYRFFQDDDSNGVDDPAQYDSGEVINTIYLDPRYELASICVNGVGPSCTAVNDLAVSFRRPNFDADFYSSGAGIINEAHITISPIGETATRTVSIYPSGRIDAR